MQSPSKELTNFLFHFYYENYSFTRCIACTNFEDAASCNADTTCYWCGNGICTNSAQSCPSCSRITDKTICKASSKCDWCGSGCAEKGKCPHKTTTILFFALGIPAVVLIVFIVVFRCRKGFRKFRIGRTLNRFQLLDEEAVELEGETEFPEIGSVLHNAQPEGETVILPPEHSLFPLERADEHKPFDSVKEFKIGQLYTDVLKFSAKEEVDWKLNVPSNPASFTLRVSPQAGHIKAGEALSITLEIVISTNFKGSLNFVLSAGISFSHFPSI